MHAGVPPPRPALSSPPHSPEHAHRRSCRFGLTHGCAYPGTALYRETIYEHVWGGEYSYGSKTVDLHIQRLRKKVGWENRLLAVNKVGYRLEV